MSADYSQGNSLREMSSYGKKVFGVACGLTASNWIAFALILGTVRKFQEYQPNAKYETSENFELF